MAEWPTEGPLIVRLLILGLTSGLLGWLLRSFPGRAHRWIGRRVNAERRAVHWEMIATQQQEEIEAILRRVEGNRDRARRLDSALGSGTSSAGQNPSPPPSTSSEVSKPSTGN